MKTNILTRNAFLWSLAAPALPVLATASQSAAARPPMHHFERQDLIVDDFRAEGYILDIGGGGEGIIGRMKPDQTVAIDLYERELLEAPPGPLKIIMDATEMKFLNDHFHTCTAFFSLMYMWKPETRQKAFKETYRVLKPGGRWLIWDAVIPTCLEERTKGPVFYFTFKLPKEEVRTGYGTLWPSSALDLTYYSNLARETGFEIAHTSENKGGFTTFRLELCKPAEPERPVSGQSARTSRNRAAPRQ
jgi:SAM-dependent methyltransferase